MSNETYLEGRTKREVKNTTYKYTVNIDREITRPSDWREELSVLRTAAEGDDVYLNINCCGGNALTLMEMLHLIGKSKATFHGVLAGAAYSAGGCIALACDTLEVGELAELMVHTVQATFGSTSAQGGVAIAGMTARTAKELLTLGYKGFMTQAEITQALDGKEFWFSSDEIKERLIIREKLRKVDVDGN